MEGPQEMRFQILQLLIVFHIFPFLLLWAREREFPPQTQCLRLSWKASGGGTRTQPDKTGHDLDLLLSGLLTGGLGIVVVR